MEGAAHWRLIRILIRHQGSLRDGWHCRKDDYFYRNCKFRWTGREGDDYFWGDILRSATKRRSVGFRIRRLNLAAVWLENGVVVVTICFVVLSFLYAVELRRVLSIRPLYVFYLYFRDSPIIVQLLLQKIIISLDKTTLCVLIIFRQPEKPTL